MRHGTKAMTLRTNHHQNLCKRSPSKHAPPIRPSQHEHIGHRRTATQSHTTCSIAASNDETSSHSHAAHCHGLHGVPRHVPGRWHRCVLGPERRRGVAGRDVRVRQLRVRHHRLPPQVRQGTVAADGPREPLRSLVGRVHRPEQGHPRVPAPRGQGPPLHRRRRRQLRPLVPRGRPAGGRVPLEQLPRRLLVVPAPRQRRPRRHRLRHRARRHQVLGRPRQGSEEPGQERRQEGAAERGAAVPVPGRVGRRCDQHGAVRPRVGTVLQQPGVPVQRGARGVHGRVEEVGVGAGGAPLPGASRLQGRCGHRVRARRRAQLARAAAYPRLAQVRRRHALVQVLRRPNRLQLRHQEPRVISPCMCFKSVLYVLAYENTRTYVRLRNTRHAVLSRLM